MFTRGYILVVDDQEAICSALCALLSSAGYQTIAAPSGSEALARIAERLPALIILDVMMPGLDGYEVCRRVRHSSQYVPIMMLTARHDVSDKLVGLELGADVYLAKPFDPRELLAQVKALFRLLAEHPQVEQAKELPRQCGPLALWERERRVKLNGKDVQLTPKEYELLSLFMQNPGRAFGRETLLRHVWGYDYAGDTRTVDVHVQRLRAKIEENPGEPRWLQTVRGFGYRLAAGEPE